jgi:hypothetical protein
VTSRLCVFAFETKYFKLIFVLTIKKKRMNAMKRLYKTGLILLMPLFPAPVLYAQDNVLVIDAAADGTGAINGTYSGVTISSDMSVAGGMGACPTDGDIWYMDTNLKEIVIQNNSPEDIESIVLTGILLNANGSALVLCNRRLSADGSGSDLIPPLTNVFTAADGTCVAYRYDNDAADGVYPRYFRFTSPMTSVLNQPGIQSIAVYFTGTQTLLERVDADADGLSIEVSGNEIRFGGTVSAASVYDVSGIPVITVREAESIATSTLPPGIYIVKVTGKTGKTVVTKIVR